MDLSQRTSQPPQQPVRLPIGLIDATIRVAEREGLTRTATLSMLVQYALETMPPGWRR